MEVGARRSAAVVVAPPVPLSAATSVAGSGPAAETAFDLLIDELDARVEHQGMARCRARRLVLPSA